MDGCPSDIFETAYDLLATVPCTLSIDSTPAFGYNLNHSYLIISLLVGKDR
jgi:hypothetical protein